MLVCWTWVLSPNGASYYSQGGRQSKWNHPRLQRLYKGAHIKNLKTEQNNLNSNDRNKIIKKKSDTVLK